jgi:hypothetical protein
MRIDREGSAGAGRSSVPSPGSLANRQVVLAAEEKPSQPKVPYRTELVPSVTRSQTSFEFFSGEHSDAPCMQLDRGSRNGLHTRWL